MGFLNGIFGNSSSKEVKKVSSIADKIMELEPEMQKLSDEQLKDKTAEFKEKLKNGAKLDDILVEAYAVVREAAWRVLGLKPYRVQLIGGIILNQGRIAEMKTGEGKTLVAAMPSYLNALEGNGVHVITVNDYLANRDKEQIGKIHQFLGLSVGCILHGLDNDERRENYNCDITYGTNNEFGFDYLRDNMVIYKNEQVQRGLNYAIVDEVDSILIDEARTPLIISGEGDESTDLYVKADAFVKGLRGRILDPKEEDDQLFDREWIMEDVDFVVDEKRKTSNLTEKGTAKAEKYFGLENLSDLSNMELSHNINQALKANNNMRKDIDYVVRDGEVLIVDEFTGRIMDGRRYSEGLHQAIEAKEGVEVKAESKTLATVTYQNYFRMYKKLSGMTGTAKTEEDEFSEIYNMDVVEIPTNKPVIRNDYHDRVYVNEKGKFNSIVKDIKEIHAKHQPILVGTISIEKSEELSKALKKEKIEHQVLNAKNHEREAEIVAQAGVLDKVTIATNMAGRGTDIILGGNPDFLARHDMKKQGYEAYILDNLDSFIEIDDPDVLKARNVYQKLLEKYKEQTAKNAQEVIKAGGLFIVGTERHESRRIDNQLRGRAGRQGDPGASRFYISLEDHLMRLFGGNTLQKIAKSGKYPEDEPLEFRTVTSAIERAQKRVEANNFGIRKNVLQYDDVMNIQRKVIYGERDKVLSGQNMKEYIMSMLKEIIDEGVNTFTEDKPKHYEWDKEALINYMENICFKGKDIDWKVIETMTPKELSGYLYNTATEIYDGIEESVGSEKFREIERVILLMVTDRHWMEHLDAMDQMRQGIGVRSYGQEDPIRAYNQEGFAMFEEMNHLIKENTIQALFRVQPVDTREVQRTRVVKEKEDKELHQPILKNKKVGRNDPCPCGSGKKYKNCCGK